MIFDTEPEIKVGIVTARDIDVTYLGGAEPCFELRNVVIGKNFHWQRTETQRFQGKLEIQKDPDGTLTAVNVIPVEEYLKSVISSEMSATSSKELLKAHAVISRSWLLAQIYRTLRHNGEQVENMGGKIEQPDRCIRWYDREDHQGYDVCADDHCQRYQGITRQTAPTVAQAVEETRGMLLLYQGEICDARFSKCCGGVTEEYKACWEPHNHPYLTVLRDNAQPQERIPDLSLEDEARAWILSEPDAFCSTRDPEVLRQILNNYDREDPDFYRWKVVYTPGELDALVARRSGVDFGNIQALNPVNRGHSGRITELEIVGSQCTMRVGKELEIRKWLSESHLKSSAFVVDRDEKGNWLLSGAGWGHGVGLCQIGAAVMALKGYDYQAILSHYFPGAELTKCYD